MSPSRTPEYRRARWAARDRSKDAARSARRRANGEGAQAWAALKADPEAYAEYQLARKVKASWKHS